MDYKSKIQKYKNKYNLINQYGGRVKIGDLVQYYDIPIYYKVIENNEGSTFRIQNGAILRHLDDHVSWRKVDDPIDIFSKLQTKTYKYNIEGQISNIPFNEISTLHIQARNYNVINYIIYSLTVELINRLIKDRKYMKAFGQSVQVILENNQCVITLPYNYKLVISSKFITITNFDNTIKKYILLKTYDTYNTSSGFLIIDQITNEVDDRYINRISKDQTLDELIKTGGLEHDVAYILSFAIIYNLRKYDCIFTCDDQYLNINIPVLKNLINPIINLEGNIINNNYKLKIIDLHEKFLENVYFNYIVNYYDDNNLKKTHVVILKYNNIISYIVLISQYVTFNLYYYIDRKQFSFVCKSLKRGITPTESNLDGLLRDDSNWNIKFNNMTICYDKTLQILYPLLTNPVDIHYNKRKFTLVGESKQVESYGSTEKSFYAVSYMFLMLNNFINRFKRLFIINEQILPQHIKINLANTIAMQTFFLDYSSLLEEEVVKSKMKSPKKQKPEVPASEEKIAELLDETNDVSLPEHAGIVPEQYMLPYKKHFKQGLIKLLPDNVESFVNKIQLNIQTYNPYLKIITNTTKCIIYLSNPDRINTIHLSLFFEELVKGRFHFTHELLKDAVSHNYFNFKFSIGIKEIFIFNRRSITNIEEIIDYYFQLLDNPDNLNDKGIELLSRPKITIDNIKDITQQSILEIFNYIYQFIKENYVYFGPHDDLD